MTPSRALLLGAFLPLTVLFLGAGQKLREEVRAALDRGLAAYQRGELDAAIESFETALSAEPENVRARFNLARALHQAGKGERALQELLGLEGRMQDRARYLSLLGQIYADSERFAELGLRDDTLLVLTSDHGEGLGDHGETLHGFFVYQSTLAVPLLFRGPGVVPGTRLSVTARTVDLFPTILDLAGVTTPPELQLSGRSLAGALQGREELAEEASYAETLIPLLHFGWSDLRSLRKGRWKYTEAPRPELYDLEQDPMETRNVVTSEPSRTRALRAALALILEQERSASGSAPQLGDVPLELLEKLGALGYVGGVSATESTGADPKDKIDEFRAASRLLREGLTRFREKDLAGSIERFQSLLRLIDSFEARYYLGRSLLASKRYKEAAVQ